MGTMEGREFLSVPSKAMHWEVDTWSHITKIIGFLVWTVAFRLTVVPFSELGFLGEETLLLYLSKLKCYKTHCQCLLFLLCDKTLALVW